MPGPNDGLPAANDSSVGANEKNHRGARTKAAYAHPNAVFLSRRVGWQHNKSKYSSNLNPRVNLKSGDGRGGQVYMMKR